MREGRILLEARLAAIVPQIEQVLDTRRPRELEVPGRAEHRSMIHRAISQAWITGHQLADEELADERRITRFAEIPETPQPSHGPPPDAAIEWLRKRDVLLGKWDRDLDAQVNEVLIQALETGVAKKKVMEALAGVFQNFSSVRLEIIARTELSAALTQGRISRYREPGSNVVAVQFFAIMDARTTAICRSRDGLIMKLDDEKLPGNTPPLHFMCRSTLVGITDWVWEDLENGDERALKRWFGWLKGEDAPKDLTDALDWRKATPPGKGFGDTLTPVSPKAKVLPKSDGDAPLTTPAPPRTSIGEGEEKASSSVQVGQRQASGEAAKADRRRQPESSRPDASGGEGFDPVQKEPNPESVPVVRRLLDERRVNIEPTALKYSEPDVRSSFGNKLKNVEVALEKSLSRFPPRLLEVIEQSEGFITVTHEIAVQRGARLSRLSGAYYRKTGQILLTAQAIGDDKGVTEEEVIHLMDHLLGSSGKGKNLSEGAFIKASLAGLAQEISNLYETVNLSSYSRTNPREWLAQAARLYLSYPEELRELDPAVYSLMERWFSNEHWESIL